MKEKAIFNWSGGKDSSMTLYKVLNERFWDVQYLLTSINEKYQRISMHGVRLNLLEQQAQAIGIPLRLLRMPETYSMNEYDEMMRASLSGFVDEGIQHAIFGDIYLEDLRQYREDQLDKIGMQGAFPLWKISTTQLAGEFIDVGFKAVLVCVDQRHLDESFIGREYDDALLADLPQGVDPCGENGEFHTFVYDGPIFQHPIPFTRGDIVYRQYKAQPLADDDTYQPASTAVSTGFWYCDLVNT